MEGDNFLSDLLDVNQFEPGVLNILEAPCGCGKTTCAINRIAPLASSPRKALYLIDTRNGCERLSQEERLTTPYQYYADEIAGHYFNFDIPDKVVVATYARFGMWVSQYPNFADHFEIIICDEAHNLVQFATFSPEPNYASIARDAIRDAVLIGKTKVIAITATTDFLKRLKCPKKIYMWIELRYATIPKHRPYAMPASTNCCGRFRPTKSAGYMFLASIKCSNLKQSHRNADADPFVYGAFPTKTTR